MSKKIFSTKKRYSESIVGGGLEQTVFGYDFGFFDATEILVSAAKNDVSMSTNLFYPICFVFRHYIEISLKDLIADATFVCQTNVPNDDVNRLSLLGYSQKMSKEHSLARLVNWLNAILVSINLSKIDTKVMRIIEEFHNLDPNGQAFRYPRKKDRTLTIPSELSLDLNQISASMHVVRTELFDLDTILSEEIVKIANRSN